MFDENEINRGCDLTLTAYVLGLTTLIIPAHSTLNHFTTKLLLLLNAYMLKNTLATKWSVYLLVLLKANPLKLGLSLKVKDEGLWKTLKQLP